MPLKNYISNSSTFGKIFIVAGLALFFLGIFSLLSVWIVSQVFHLPLITNPEILKDTENLEVIKALKWMQIMQAFGLFIVPSVVFARLNQSHILSFLALHKAPLFYTSLCVILLMLGVQPLINGMAELNSLVPVPQWMRESEKEAAAITQVFLRMDGIDGLVVNLFLIGLIPALGEELLFRGVLQPLFQKITNNKHWGIWIAAILFSALHVQFLGFFPRMFMGAAFGYLLFWSGSLWLPILGHFINNAGAVLISYLIQQNRLSEQAETIGTGKEGIIFVFISAAFTLGLLFLIHKAEKSKGKLTN